MSVISLFNGAIPLIALQLSAYKQGESYSLAFTKVLDRVTYASEEDEQFEVTDRKYWENKSTPKMLKEMDSIFDDLQGIIGGYSLKYNKFYIGMTKDGISKNFLMFRPKKNYLYLVFKGQDDSDLLQTAEENEIEITYKPRWKEYYVRIKDYDEYTKHKQFIESCVQKSMEYFNISE